MGTSRFIYNYYLNKKIERYKVYKRNYSLKDMKHALKDLKNARKYYTHLITKKLLDNNDIIFTENLQIKKMLQEGTHTLARRIANSSFSEIIRQLEYKAEWQNKKVIHINTYYPSSQICAHCDNKNEQVKDLNVRKWTCNNCSNENDRDLNTSENILMEGLRIYFKNKLI